MINIRHTIASLALTATALGAAAQQSSTPQSIERKMIESLWFSNTDNAAGVQTDKMGYYSRLSVNYDKTEGRFKRAQEGRNNDGYGFSTDGGGTFDNLGGTFLWGYFDYSHDKIRDARFNASLIDPLRGMPYYIADNNSSNWINQDYSLGMKAATPVLWQRLVLGVGLDYQNAQGAKQLDPRPKVLMSKFTVTPSVAVTLGRHTVGADFSYFSRREDGLATNSNVFINQPVWEVLAPGFFTSGEIGAGVKGLRDYNANSLGGGVQYSFSTDKLRLLVSGKYTRTVEDANNNYTTPKIIGTTREDTWQGRIDLLWDIAPSHTLILGGEYYDRNIDGIEYIQVYDNSADVAQWVVLAKNVRSAYSTRRADLRLDYMNSDRGNAYRWMAGVELCYEKLSDIYYIPLSTQHTDNLLLELHAKRNFVFGLNSLLVGAHAAYKAPLDSARSYTGQNADSEIYTDLVLHDYDFLRCKSYAAGGELTYARSGLLGPRTSLFASAALDYRKASDSSIDRRFGHRMYLSVKVGLAF